MKRNGILAALAVLTLTLGASIYTGSSDASAAAIQLRPAPVQLKPGAAQTIQQGLGLAPSPIVCDGSVIYAKGGNISENSTIGNFGIAFDRVKNSNAHCGYGIRIGAISTVGQGYEVLCPANEFHAGGVGNSRQFHCELGASQTDVYADGLGEYHKDYLDGDGVVRLHYGSQTDIEVRTLVNGL